MPVIKNISFFLIVLVFSLYSETHITGDITGMTFESGGNPYIVEQDILIPAGSKAVIKEGCIFLFKPFTGLTVHGHIVVEGTPEKPVIFSSVNDGEFNSESEQLPNPFDWNGILISRESGTVTFNNFGLRFSVYGIKSQNTNIMLENGLFRQNGQFHFTINEKIQFVQDNIPYSYKGTTEQDKTEKPPKPPIQKNDKKISSTKKILRYTSLGVGALGAIGGIAFGINTNNIYFEWKTKTRYSEEGGNKMDQVDYNKYKNDFNLNRNLAITSGIIGGIGLTVFGLTFVF
jgi:hypothetical protein